MDSNRNYLKRLLTQSLPTVGYRIPDCSYLAWLDLASLNLGENPSQVLLEKGKLALNPGITFGPESGNFVRLNFATSEEILDEAVSRIASCLS
jgi:cystathionine beta-lyase